MSLLAFSSHGTLIARAPAASPFTFTTIAELGDITPPELMRNEFDSTTQQEDIDSYILGVLRRGPVTFPFNFIPADPTHDELTGLQSAIIANSRDGYRFTTPGGWTLIASGAVQRIVPHAPVDGKLSADVTLRLSGKMWIRGVLVG